MPKTAEVGEAIVNLEELAELTRKSLPTLRVLMREHDDFPVVKGGTKGTPYEFDARAVAAWLAELDAAAAAAIERRAEELKAMRLELFPGSAADDETLTLSPSQRKQELEAVRLADLVAEQRGQLTRVAEVLDDWQRAFAALRSKLIALPDELARDLALDRGTRTRLRDGLDAALVELAAMMREEVPDQRAA